MQKLCHLVRRCSDSNTRGHCISALMKLVAQNGSCPYGVQQLVLLYSHSISLNVQQRLGNEYLC
jgi:hypothetical protein